MTTVWVYAASFTTESQYPTPRFIRFHLHGLPGLDSNLAEMASGWSCGGTRGFVSQVTTWSQYLEQAWR